MTTQFPTTLDAYAAVPTNQNVVVKHHDRHQNIEDAMEAVQAKVGVNGSTVQTSLDYRVSMLEGNPSLPGLDSERVSYTPPFTGSASRTQEAKNADAVSVKDFGAVGDGVADDWPKFQAAWSYCQSTGRPLYIPRGTYNLSAATTYLEPFSGCVVYGDGMEASKIVWNKTIAQNLFHRPPSLARLDSVQFRDFWVYGGHGDSGNYTQVSAYPFLLYRCDTLVFERVRVSNSRVFGIATRDCDSVLVTGCEVRYCARDGINTADCAYVVVTGNRVEFCDDDGIAHHSAVGAAVDRGWVCTGNIVRFSQGIKGLGVQSASISGNLVEFCMSHGIDVATVASGGGSEGRSATNGVTISGNTIKNIVDRTMVDGLNASPGYIRVSGASAQAGGLAVVPGRNNTGTGTVISPYPYFKTPALDTDPIPDSLNITISGNSLVRDIPTGAVISALGFGSFYTRNGPVDPVVTSAGIKINGIFCLGGGIVRNLQVKNCLMYGIGNAVEISSTATLLDAVISNNTIFDCDTALALSGTNVHRIQMVGNTIDLDPYHANANRGANGTYLADSSPTAILIQSAAGVAFGGNLFRNCCRISDQSVTNVTTLQGTKLQLLSENYIDCDPAAIGFSTSNKGIGNLPRGTEFIMRVIDSDPASATFGQILNHCPQSTSAIPTAGKFLFGHVVKNNNPAVAGGGGSQYIVVGWMRMSTGSAHVLNTDWREMRTLTGT